MIKIINMGTGQEIYMDEAGFEGPKEALIEAWRQEHGDVNWWRPEELRLQPVVEEGKEHYFIGGLAVRKR